MSALLIERIGTGATVQDLGRPGRMHEGVPPGGPLVRCLFQRANLSLGNERDAAALELPLHGCVVRATAGITISVDGELHHLVENESMAIDPSSEAVRYLALPGGIDVPLVLGSRGTLLAASLGGLHGRTMRKGDRLAALAPSVNPASPLPFEPLALETHLPLVRGPDFADTNAFEQLLSLELRVSALQDRVGTRLEGEKLNRPAKDRRGSYPMVRGAIQVTTDGSLIVLGPDHPTTGGYPVVGVIASGHIDTFARRRPGTVIRFTEMRASHGMML